MVKLKKINEGFICLKCGKKVPPALKTCRNHCPFCLWSLHVDKDFPGDRKSDCKGLMEPIFLKKDSTQWKILHKCIKCNKEQYNIIAEDDNWDEIIKISTNFINNI